MSEATVSAESAAPAPDAAPASAAPALSARRLHRAYAGAAGENLHVLRGVDLDLRPGEAVAIVGASGTGKSTLLHLLGALDRPTSGSVRLAGVEVASLDGDDAAALRNRLVGFVFQFHHLLADFTAVENVMTPSLIAGERPRRARRRAAALLSQVGMEGRLEHKPSELSGGEQQRVAVARALVNEPRVVLADEPTGNLDTATGQQVQQLLFDLKERYGVALLVATHDRQLAARADRVMKLEEGVLRDVH